MADSELNKVKVDVPTALPGKFDKSPLVELKNGKVILRQKPISFETMSETMQEIVNFREMIERRRLARNPPMETIPEEHLPLIAKLVHESEKNITSLTKHIQRALQPIQLESCQEYEDSELQTQQHEQLPFALIELAITSVAERVNYGINHTEKVPASLCVWRWEVKEQRRDWLPKSGKDKVAARIAEREKAKNDVLALFEALPEQQREAMLKSNKKDRYNESIPLNNTKQRMGQEEENDKDLGQRTAESSSSHRGPSRPKKDKDIDPEKAAKEQERSERKAAKAEKDRKEKEAQNKSRSLLSAFLTKSKPAGEVARSHVNKVSPSDSPNQNTASSSQSDFEKTFKPFVLKKGANLASSNWFIQRAKRTEVVVLDQDEEIVTTDTFLSDGGKEPVCNIDPIELLNSFLEGPLPSLDSRRNRRTRARQPDVSHLKSTSLYCVRTILEQLSEAEVAGDTSAVRHLTNVLKSRPAIPAKVLIFHDDTRPGYFGTFTKNSSIVGPRTPLAKDAVVFDYSYDSGAEWEEQEEGADDLMSLDGSVDEDANSVDSDLDGWLVDDNEVDPGSPLSEREGSPEFPPPSLPKRKSTTGGERTEAKKRKVVIPLVPFIKGPCWEDEIGHCEYTALKPYRIQLFHDTPYPVNPFTFVAAPIVEEHPSSSKHVFVVPAIPDHILTSSQSIGQISQDVGASTTTTLSTASLLPPKRKSAPIPLPKTTFPDAHLPHLVSKINQLATGSLIGLVESIYQDLKEHKVKKNSIEAKVKEIGEKCRIKKVWVVKEDAWMTLGLPKP